jgi:hypothetical protein
MLIVIFCCALLIALTTLMHYEVLSSLNLRLLAGTEALNGLLLIVGQPLMSILRWSGSGAAAARMAIPDRQDGPAIKGSWASKRLAVNPCTSSVDKFVHHFRENPRMPCLAGDSTGCPPNRQCA